MRILLVSPYELGRQPFSLAHPAALLRARGHTVILADLTLGSLPWDNLADCDLIGIALGMHTATRVAIHLLPQIRQRAARARLVCYGLYGPPNAAALEAVGVNVVLGPEFEADLLNLVAALAGSSERLSRVPFVVPDRSTMAGLQRYAHLMLPGGGRKTVGFVEASRGCKYLCRHCPVVPVYEGRFRAIPRELVVADAEQQIAEGAEHLSFGDPDFLNGPTHALRILENIHGRWPHITFDATIKISHILNHREIIPKLRELGCVFITSAAESFNDAILERLDKGHTGPDIAAALAITRAAGITLSPTFVPFTPWTGLNDYLGLLTQVHKLGLINCVAPIQLVIRLLIPEGSYLLRLPDFLASIEPFAPATLGYPWRHDDPRVDQLQVRAQRLVEQADNEGQDRFATFAGLWALAHEALGQSPPALDRATAGPESPHLSEPWYCCAEPTTAQLAAGSVGT